MNNDPQQPTQYTEQQSQYSPYPQTPEAPLPPQDNNFIVAPPPKKSHKGLIWIIIAAAVLLIGGGAAAYFLMQPKTTENTAQTATTDEADQKGNAKDLLSKVRTAVSDQLGAKFPLITFTESTGAPMYAVPDKKYSVVSNDFGTRISIETKEDTFNAASYAEISTVATTVLKEQNNLKETVKDWQTTYQNESVICSVSTDGAPANIVCADVKDYKELISQVAPFATAFLASDAQSKENVSFASPKITKKPNGYSNATLAMGSSESPIGGYAGLFYAKDDNWSYWRGTQSLLDCADYNTADLRYAFEGDACYDSVAQKDSTVSGTVKPTTR